MTGGPGDVAQRLVHNVEFVDHVNRDPRACVPDRVYIDGIEITGALAMSSVTLPHRWAVENHGGALVVTLSLYPGRTKVTADAYGPGTFKVELIAHPELEPIELCTPDLGDGSPPVLVAHDAMNLGLRVREVVRFYAASVRFRHASLPERTALVFVR